MLSDKINTNAIKIISIFLTVCFMSCKNKTQSVSQNVPGLSNMVTGDTLQKYLLSADSVVLISHLVPTNAPPDPQTGRKQSGSTLLEDGKISESLFQKSKRISRADIIQLGNLLDEDVVDDIEYTNCFSPRNAILAYKNNKISYLDVCFSCLGIDISDFPEQFEMNEKKYEKLKNFFAFHEIE